MRINQTINTTPNFQVLSEDQIERIYFAALDVLENTGARFHHKEALEMFKNSDAVVTDGNLVRFPASLVERAIKSHPRKINVTGRTGKHTIKLQKDEVTFGTGSDMPFAYDKETGERRKASYQDVKNAGTIVDYLPNFDFFMSHGIVQDVPNEQTYDRHQYLAMLESCTKPYIVTAVDGEGLEDIYRMTTLFRNEEELRLDPMFIVYNEPSSPLTNSEPAIEKLLFCAEKSVPCMYTPCPSGGATAPATPAGLLVQTLAECLMGSVLSYLKKPGMPFIVGGVITVLDMATTAYSYGAPELSLCQAGFTDIAKWLDLPMFSTGGCSDSKAMDEQAAIEMSTNLYYAFLSGANLVHDVGYMDSGLTASLDSLVMCDEIIGMIKQIGKGINTEDEYMALQLIDKVGPGGEYLTTDHTLQHYKEWFQPKLQDRSDYDTWEREGKKLMIDRIKTERDRILSQHTPEHIDEKVHRELKKIIEEAEIRHTK
ncbi:MAG: trimethylamine methyltransferase family protein [Desulfurivibrionaceae bacterium]